MKFLKLIILFTLTSSCSNYTKPHAELFKAQIFYSQDSLSNQFYYDFNHIYFYVNIINKSESKIFFPISEKVDNGYKSRIKILYRKDTLNLYSIKTVKYNYIKPCDTLTIGLGVTDNSYKKMLLIGIDTNNDLMNFLKDLELFYISDKDDYKKLNIPICPSISIKKSNNFKIDNIMINSEEKSIMWY